MPQSGNQLSLIKPLSKASDLIPSSFYSKKPSYRGWVQIDSDHYWTKEFATKKGARTALQKLKDKLAFDAIVTVEMEGPYPERARILEELYQETGRKNGLYTGLVSNHGTISNDTSS